MRNPNSSLKPAINSGESVLSNIEQRGILQPLFIPLALLILTLVGLYFRLTYAMTTSPYIDEYTTMWVAQRTIQYGYPVFSTGAIYSQGMLFTYIDALFIHLFGLSKLVARMPSVIISVGTIPLLYWVGKRVFSAQTGLLAAALLAFDPQSIIWGGRARNYALFALLVLSATYLLYEGLIRRDDPRRRRFYVLCFLAAVFTHNEALLLFPAFVVVTFLRRGWRWFLRGEMIGEHLLSVLGMGLTVYLYRRLRPPGWLEVGVGRPAFGPSLNILGAVRRYSPFFVGPDHLPFVPLLTLLVLIGFFLLLKAWWRGGIALAREGKELGLVFLYLLFGLLILEMFFVVGERRRSYRYLFMLSPFFFLIASRVLIKSLRFLEDRLQRWNAGISRVTAAWPLDFGINSATGVVVFLIAVFAFPTAKAVASQKEWGYDLAFQYVKEHRLEGDKVMTFATSACVLYLGDCDYVAVEKEFHAYAVRRDDYWIEAWAGVLFLTTDEELMDVIEGGRRIWFIIDEERFRTRYTDGFIQYVWDRMELVAKERGVFVFLAESPPPPPPALRRELYFELGGQAALLGYSLNGDTFRPGEELNLTLRWKGLTHILKDYSVFVHLLDAQTRLWAQGDNAPIKGLHPTSYWVAGEVIRDSHDITLPPDIPPGRYRLEIGMYSPTTMERLPVAGSREESVTIDYIWVTKGKEEPRPQYPWEANLGDKVALLGYDLEVKEARPGDTLHLTLYWQAQREMDEDYTVFVHLIDGEGTIWGQKDGWPEGGFYPTSFWDPGEVVRDQYDLVIDPPALPGLYRFEVGLYLLATGERLPIIERGEVVGNRIILGEVEVR